MRGVPQHSTPSLLINGRGPWRCALDDEDGVFSRMRNSRYVDEHRKRKTSSQQAFHANNRILLENYYLPGDVEPRSGR